MATSHRMRATGDQASTSRGAPAGVVCSRCFSRFRVLVAPVHRPLLLPSSTWLVQHSRCNAHQANSASFDRSVTEVSATASLDLERIEDLAVATAAFVAESPNFTSADFRLWAGSVYRPGRIPGVSALLFVRYVPAKELSAYTSSVKPPGAFKLVPQGRYPYYCFIPEGTPSTPRRCDQRRPADSRRESAIKRTACERRSLFHRRRPLLLRAAHQRRAVSGKFVIGGAHRLRSRSRVSQRRARQGHGFEPRRVARMGGRVL